MLPFEEVLGSLNANAVRNPPLAVGLVFVSVTVIIAEPGSWFVTWIEPVNKPGLSLSPK